MKNVGVSEYSDGFFIGYPDDGYYDINNHWTNNGRKVFLGKDPLEVAKLLENIVSGLKQMHHKAKFPTKLTPFASISKAVLSLNTVDKIYNNQAHYTDNQGNFFSVIAYKDEIGKYSWKAVYIEPLTGISREIALVEVEDKK